MVLSKHTPCQVLEIFAPRWRDKTVMLAPWKLGEHNEVRILAKRSDGSPYFPAPMYISGKVAKTYPLDNNGSAYMHAVPITKLEPLERK